MAKGLAAAHDKGKKPHPRSPSGSDHSIRVERGKRVGIGAIEGLDPRSDELSRAHHVAVCFRHARDDTSGLPLWPYCPLRFFRIFTNERPRSSSSVIPVPSTSSSGIAPHAMPLRKKLSKP